MDVKGKVEAALRDVMDLDPEEAEDVASKTISDSIIVESDITSIQDRITKRGDKAFSIKPYNYMKNIMETVSAAGAGLALFSSSGLILVFAFLVFVAQITGASVVNLEKVEAIIVSVLWKYESKSTGTSVDNLLKETNEKLKEKNMSLLKRGDLINSLNKLESIKIIDMRDGMVWLVERVSPDIPI